MMGYDRVLVLRWVFTMAAHVDRGSGGEVIGCQAVASVSRQKLGITDGSYAVVFRVPNSCRILNLNHVSCELSV